MSPSQIQEVHRHRHIVVTNVDNGRPIQFNEDGLEMLGDIDAEVQIQRMQPPLYLLLTLLTDGRN